MYNWNTDTKELAKNKEKFEIWKLNQMLNFGLNGKKIRLNLIKKYWHRLSLDPQRKKFLNLALWGKQS